jgi:hypothetical protein
MRIRPPSRLSGYAPGWGGSLAGLRGLGQDDGSGDNIDLGYGTTPAAPTPTVNQPTSPSFAPGSCWDSSLNPIACGAGGAAYVVTAGGNLVGYSAASPASAPTPAGGGLTASQLAAIINAGTASTIGITKALSTPGLVSGTGVIYNAATGQFYNPQTGQVVAPTAGSSPSTLGLTATSLTSMTPFLLLALGAVLVFSLAGGRH